MSDRLYVADVDGCGRGVFTRRFIPKGGVIETCPVIVCTAREYRLLKQTVLINYVFEFPTRFRAGKCRRYTGTCIPLGFAMLYNHSNEPNATWWACPKQRLIKFKSLRDIQADEQITYNYGWSEYELSKLKG